MEPSWWSEGEAPPVVTSNASAPTGRRRDTRQVDLFEVAATTESWIDTLLASTTYIAQRELAGRGAPDDSVVRALVATLSARGGRLSRTALAQSLQVPAFRAGGIVNAARRVLNVDQAQVLSIDAAADEVVLDVRLLRFQFEIGGTP